MKKKIYKLVSVAIIAVAMFVSVQMSNTNNMPSDISIMAMAEKLEPIGQICYEGQIDKFGFYVHCDDCTLRPFQSLGSTGTCFSN